MYKPRAGSATFRRNECVFVSPTMPRRVPTLPQLQCFFETPGGFRIHMLSSSFHWSLAGIKGGVWHGEVGRACSSVVEHLTGNQKVVGLSPTMFGSPFFCRRLILNFGF